MAPDKKYGTVAAADMERLLGRTDDRALMQADTGSHYQSVYSYFYVPETVGADTRTDDDAGLGVFLRLGEYADQEETARLAGTTASYYPAQHISDEGDEAQAVTNAAGGGRGILLACDGRALIRSAEKMYLESEDFHQKVRGKCTLDVVAETSITSAGAITMISP